MNLDVILYQDAKGKTPVAAWLASLDKIVRTRIQQRIARLSLGHFGDVKPVGGQVHELRFFFGAGYRVYFGKEGKQIVVLLCGGDKSSQTSDIKKAKEYWHDYQTT